MNIILDEDELNEFGDSLRRIHSAHQMAIALAALSNVAGAPKTPPKVKIEIEKFLKTAQQLGLIPVGVILCPTASSPTAR